MIDGSWLAVVTAEVVASNEVTTVVVVKTVNASHNKSCNDIIYLLYP